jgi:ADP-heptose:LPS heptosyltransferase
MRLRDGTLYTILDKYLGIPAVYILGFFRKKRLLPQNIWIKTGVKVGIIKTGAIGDMLLLTAIIDEIKQINPSSIIKVINSTDNCHVSDLSKNIDRTLVFNMRRPLQSIYALEKEVPFDILLDFASWLRATAIISFFIKAEFKVGFKRINTYRHYVYDQLVDHSNDIHELENYRNILKALGLRIQCLKPTIRIGPNDLHNKIIIESTSRYAVFHMYPGGDKPYLRTWPKHKWLELAYRFRGHCDRIYITGAKADKEDAQSFIKERNRLPEIVNLAGKLSLVETAALIKGANLLVCVNTGIMHLGAMAGVKMISLNGPTSIKRWGPLPLNNGYALTGSLSCVPCLSLGYEYKCKSGGCMDTISVDEVIDAAKRLGFE